MCCSSVAVLGFVFLCSGFNSPCDHHGAQASQLKLSPKMSFAASKSRSRATQEPSSDSRSKVVSSKLQHHLASDQDSDQDISMSEGYLNPSHTQQHPIDNGAGNGDGGGGDLEVDSDDNKVDCAVADCLRCVMQPLRWLTYDAIYILIPHASDLL
jgi:hypothetical protein